ncbi:hypothetical protein CJ030_MR2G012876 [Morella rubra]|uniref:Translin n=1 Tax=Morella rubra TaxID=262757 RepID=A0A6A1WEZ8_9ROSI|nr:hypothetical protein CJ030_MR2G012876 [Morella rubra]
MRPAFRNTCLNLARSLNPNPIPLFTLFPLHAFLKASLSQPPTVLVSRFGGETFRSISPRLCSSSMAGSDTHGPSSSPSLEKQLRISRSARRVRRPARAHSSCELLEKAKAQIGVLKELYNRLAEVLRECPGQYYRYHGDWRSETQTVVSLLALIHWLETGSLLLHSEAEEKLGLNNSDFGLDIEDYLTDSKSACVIHGMKYDLKRVEEVHYDVKIRGLTANDDSMGGTRN